MDKMLTQNMSTDHGMAKDDKPPRQEGKRWTDVSYFKHFWPVRRAKPCYL
ncbi:hypothetical protein E3U43_018001 [Larimichthys crocea]|uniref:Uncharacterized protein n=1 Tax=Larimichthys crocea TaxID=215358 RepID=A0ACD3R0B2_LARCR|nr:hypothetical protein E3U43_018001 [Larimichthys crocea]